MILARSTIRDAINPYGVEKRYFDTRWLYTTDNSVISTCNDTYTYKESTRILPFILEGHSSNSILEAFNNFKRNIFDFYNRSDKIPLCIYLREKEEFGFETFDNYCELLGKEMDFDTASFRDAELTVNQRLKDINDSDKRVIKYSFITQLIVIDSKIDKYYQESKKDIFSITRELV